MLLPSASTPHCLPPSHAFPLHAPAFRRPEIVGSGGRSGAREAERDLDVPVDALSRSHQHSPLTGAFLFLTKLFQSAQGRQTALPDRNTCAPGAVGTTSTPFRRPLPHSPPGRLVVGTGAPPARVGSAAPPASHSGIPPRALAGRGRCPASGAEASGSALTFSSQF